MSGPVLLCCVTCGRPAAATDGFRNYCPTHTDGLRAAVLGVSAVPTISRSADVSLAPASPAASWLEVERLALDISADAMRREEESDVAREVNEQALRLIAGVLRNHLRSNGGMRLSKVRGLLKIADDALGNVYGLPHSEV